MNKIMCGLLGIVLAGCASTGKLVLDSSANKPSWASSNKVVWQDGNKFLFKAQHTIRGDERLSGCYDLARLDAKESLLSEISNEVRGSLNNAQESISEQAETVLTKMRSSEFSGTISGLRFSEQYFERYKIGETERIDCQTLGEMSAADFNRTKQAVINKVVAVDPRIKEAIAKKNIDFFGKRENASEPAQE